jgi:hypothetical protein
MLSCITLESHNLRDLHSLGKRAGVPQPYSKAGIDADQNLSMAHAPTGCCLVLERSRVFICKLWPVYSAFTFYRLLGLTVSGLMLGSETNPVLVFIPCSLLCCLRLEKGWWRQSGV